MARARGLEKGRLVSVIGYTVTNTRLRVYWCETLLSSGFGEGHFRGPGASSLTLLCDASNLMKMIGKKLFLMLMVGTLLLLQFADCMAAVSQDQRAMQCCGTSACTPANQSHGCCKTMTSTEMPRVLVKARVSLDAPSVAVVEHAQVFETAQFTPPISPAFEPQQYFPPELYTLYGSLLI
jgi:hypothetical protein